MANSTGRSHSSWIRARATSPESRSDGFAASVLEVLGAGAKAGAGIIGVIDTAHVAWSGRVKAIMGGMVIGGGAVSAGRSTREGVFAGVAASVAGVASPFDVASPLGASAFGLASVLRSTFGTIAVAACRGVGAPDAGGVGAGPLVTGCSTDSCCKSSAADAPAGSAAVTCAGTSATRKSGTAIRRSCHGKAKPGSQPAPPKIRLNNTV